MKPSMNHSCSSVTVFGHSQPFEELGVKCPDVAENKIDSATSQEYVSANSEVTPLAARQRQLVFNVASMAQHEQPIPGYVRQTTKLVFGSWYGW